MKIRSSLRNAKYELRYALYGACGPLLQRLYQGGFNSLDNNTLDGFLGQESQLPDIAALAGTLWASYKAGKAIDGRLPKLLRGSVQTITYAVLIAAAYKAGASIDPNADSQSIDYITTIIDNLKETASCFSQGKMPPLIYAILYGGLISGAVRWTTNIGSSVVQAVAGKPGPSEESHSQK